MVDIVRTEHGTFLCQDCGCAEVCTCIGGMGDPICDCGELAFMCKCDETCRYCGYKVPDYMEKNGICDWCEAQINGEFGENPLEPRIK